MGQRIEHLKESKAYTKELWARTSLPRTTGWRGIRRFFGHPIANTRYRFWNNVPHKFTWDFEVASVGSINHEYRECDVLYLSRGCRRCGFQVDEGTFVPVDNAQAPSPGYWNMDGS